MSEAPKEAQQEVQEPKASPQQKIAVIRVRGTVNITGKVKTTLDMLRLFRNHGCSVLPQSPNVLGMLKRVKDYVTWGTIDDATYQELVSKRGVPYQGRLHDKKKIISYKKAIKVGDRLIKPFFTLQPPRKGFGRKGIKHAFVKGGALGDRKEKINDLLKRMI